MSVLIASTHVHSENSDHWARLQSFYVNKTIGDFEYCVVVNADDRSKYSNVLYYSSTLRSHLYCINIIIDTFVKSGHSHLLLLDNDCWPIRNNWMTILDNLLGQQYGYSAPARVENFDFFPHPCAFYVKREFVNSLDFSHCRIKNLLGIDVSDIGCGIPIADDVQRWYPLLKSNYINPHPLFASVYGDLFYHHCAGSRGIGFRAAGFGYYNHVLSKKEHNKIYDRITSNLIANPTKFLNNLRGIGVERGGL